MLYTHGDYINRRRLNEAEQVIHTTATQTQRPANKPSQVVYTHYFSTAFTLVPIVVVEDNCRVGASQILPLFVSPAQSFHSPEEILTHDDDDDDDSPRWNISKVCCQIRVHPPERLCLYSLCCCWCTYLERLGYNKVSIITCSSYLAKYKVF